MTVQQYHIYSDESSCPTDRYCTLAAISGKENVIGKLRHSLQHILNEKKVTELKFEDIRTHSPKIQAAAEFLKNGIEKAVNKNIRIDILLWDKQDSRHAVIGRDDVANMGRMYYKILRHIGRVWDIAVWHFYPDENSAIDWNEIATCLNKTKLAKYPSELLEIFDKRTQSFSIMETEPQKSHKEPIIQLADIFAGFAWFSRTQGTDFLKWREHTKEKNQLCLFNNGKDHSKKLKQRTINRFQLLNLIIDLCRGNKLGVSIQTNKYLKTYEPSNPVNFWNYEPQTDMDKAPTRQ